MDLNTIIMHLDNFVNTWKGWHLVAQGLIDAISMYHSSVLYIG